MSRMPMNGMMGMPGMGMSTGMGPGMMESQMGPQIPQAPPPPPPKKKPTPKKKAQAKKAKAGKKR